ncbi:DUF2786 domain-containing protein [Marinomonas sp. A79]|uniref:DUF2786 domain-containing protein n=1 Tax=Marinomonas vulgaris TaxID=2823372 RepID=A0ABS5H9I4_9GAMM|nr:DUF2786 domain-containing protein [Marinomonas vulgaris]MBR7888033.1 DUF2786 domain-containing protein [Marinomonas vulgaris]
MSITKRKKAIQKVVKLLNLATSTNSSESVVALRHAESLIRQYQIAQKELPILQLCERSMLYRVSWGGAAPRHVKESTSKPSPEPIRARRFSEKSPDPSRLYETARTILDDADLSGFHAEEVVTNAADNQATEESHEDGGKPFEATEPTSQYTTTDNVIDAAQAFRTASSTNDSFAETLKSQYATSDPKVPFQQDSYWSAMHEKLEEFDEVAVQSDIEVLDKKLNAAKETLERKKKQRYEHEQKEVQERSERARIEQSFEEAMERAFQARAKAYEAWEAECANLRMARLKEEQEASQNFEALNDALSKNKESYRQHLQRKEDYRAAQIMHDLRGQLVMAVSAEGESSFEKVIALMEGNGLSLKDLEFSDIKNKSLFIRLLERESAKIQDVHQREQHTEDMLDKFLHSNHHQKKAQPSENPVQHIQRLLITASEGGQFEAHKSLEQVIYLMEKNAIGVRDVGYGFIKKYSVFIRLINWEAERISSLSEREKFTAQILEEYIQHSVKKPGASQEQKASR